MFKIQTIDDKKRINHNENLFFPFQVDIPYSNLVVNNIFC